jgi:hypothetical protein
VDLGPLHTLRRVIAPFPTPVPNNICMLTTLHACIVASE